MDWNKVIENCPHKRTVADCMVCEDPDCADERNDDADWEAKERDRRDEQEQAARPF